MVFPPPFCDAQMEQMKEHVLHCPDCQKKLTEILSLPILKMIPGIPTAGILSHMKELSNGKTPETNRRESIPL